MTLIKKVYEYFCKFEEAVASGLLLTIATLVFISALARTFGNPINWAADIALMCFAWLVFLGGDIAIRNKRLVVIDLIVIKFPKVIQKALGLIFSVMMLAFLGLLLRFGIPLVLETTNRLMNTLTVSYAWVTLAVPVGAFFMLISTAVCLVEDIKKPVSEWGRKPFRKEEGKA